MEMEERLAELEAAHRILAAQYDALFQICRVILPIAASSNPALARRVLTSCYDMVGEHMDNLGMDDEYQAHVREQMDVLSASVLSECTHQPRPN